MDIYPGLIIVSVWCHCCRGGGEGRDIVDERGSDGGGVDVLWGPRVDRMRRVGEAVG